MSEILWLPIVVPLLGALLILSFPRDKEALITRFALSVSIFLLLFSHGALINWGLNSFTAQTLVMPDLYQHDDFRFFISLIYNSTSAVYLWVISIISFLIMKFSQTYLHREPGFKRFYATVLVFIAGMNTISLSNNIEVFFAGWEFLGLSSFVLIAFYRERVTPVRHAFKIFTIYRLGDVGLLLGAWLGHLYWHETISFSTLPEIMKHAHEASPLHVLFFLFLVLLAAAAKSAQFPFCYWLPKAMEGPTPSSAIFYGALSVHAGLLLLIRMSPVWQIHSVGPASVFVLGFVTILIASLAGRVQSNIKGQIAYSSIAQVGLMFIEVSLGFQKLALLHFAGHAFFRCYQLLVSPSVIVYLMKISNDSRIKMGHGLSLERYLPSRWRQTLYVLATHEFFLEQAVESVFWRPLKMIGNGFKFLLNRSMVLFLFVCSMTLLFLSQNTDIGSSLSPMRAPLVLLSVITILSSFSERRSAQRAWLAIGLSHLFLVTSVAIVDKFVWEHVLIYFSGILPCWTIGYLVLGQIEKGRTDLLIGFNGLVRRYPRKHKLFFFALVGAIGAPITPSFLGEDLILHHALSDKAWLAAVIAFCFIMNGLSSFRVYSRVFLGGAR